MEYSITYKFLSLDFVNLNFNYHFDIAYTCSLLFNGCKNRLFHSGEEYTCAYTLLFDLLIYSVPIKFRFEYVGSFLTYWIILQSVSSNQPGRRLLPGFKLTPDLSVTSYEHWPPGHATSHMSVYLTSELQYKFLQFRSSTFTLRLPLGFPSSNY